MTLAEELRDVFSPRFRALRTIWLAFSSAPLLYTLVAYLVTMNVSPERREEIAAGLPLSPTSMLGIGLAAAAVLAVVSIRLRSRLTDDEALIAAVSSPPKRADLTGVSEVARPMVSALARLQQSFVIVWAVQELVSVIGLVLVFITYAFMVVVPFAMVSLVLLLTSGPSEDTLAGRLESVVRRAGSTGSTG